MKSCEIKFKAKKFSDQPENFQRTFLGARRRANPRSAVEDNFQTGAPPSAPLAARKAEAGGGAGSRIFAQKKKNYRHQNPKKKHRSTFWSDACPAPEARLGTPPSSAAGLSPSSGLAAHGQHQVGEDRGRSADPRARARHPRVTLAVRRSDVTPGRLAQAIGSGLTPDQSLCHQHHPLHCTPLKGCLPLASTSTFH